MPTKRGRSSAESSPASENGKRQKETANGGCSAAKVAAAFASAEQQEMEYRLVSVSVRANKSVKLPSGVDTSYEVVSVRELNGERESQSVWRTYKDFQDIHAQLVKEGSIAREGIALPPSKWFFTMSASFIESRQKDLDQYIKRVVAAAGVTSVVLRSFLKAPQRADWPGHFGPIDLDAHDLPHESSATEWWYFNTHFTGTDGKDYSAFVAFFRVVKYVCPKTGKKSYAHALNWAISDVTGQKYFQESLLDRDSPAVVKKQLDSGDVVKDSRLKRAYEEMLDKNSVPLPDRMFTREPEISLDTLAIDMENAQVTKDATGAYHVTAITTDGKNSINLTLHPRKPAIRHGLNGVVAGHDGDDMFYYFIPRCDLTGSFSVDGEALTVAKGQGWYDHEFGGVVAENHTPMDYAWNWAAVQFDNGYELSCAVLVDPRDKDLRVMETRVVIVDPKGNRSQPDDLTFEGFDPWTSIRTFSTYPTTWRIKIPSVDTDFTINASFQDQEFISLIAKPAFWEGRVQATGRFLGQEATGVGYVERNGFSTLSRLDGFFKAVGDATRDAVKRAYPDVLEHDDAVNLVCTPETDYYLTGVPLDVLQQTLIQPVRDICDRGGKSWRSYGALACIDIVGGDARRYVDWLAMPEFMHVGSLIVDDIQDKSTTRRGGPSCHIEHGEPIAINAGTAAYFQSEKQMALPFIPPATMNKVYNYYFAALRGGHAGQALDIHGLSYLMPEAIKTGDNSIAEERILAIHLLKTAVPAGSLARMGATVGGGTEDQVQAVGKYFESVGLAFQIMDDVLNLRGLYTSTADLRENVMLKNLGEDISSGKVTIPVVKAIARLPKTEMRRLWEVIESCPENPTVIAECIQTLEDCGAIDACVDHATQLVEDAWKVLDACVPDSFSKLMLRSFGWFVIERHH